MIFLKLAGQKLLVIESSPFMHLIYVLRTNVKATQTWLGIRAPLHNSHTGNAKTPYN